MDTNDIAMSVEELLEEEERKAHDRDKAAAAKSHSNGSKGREFENNDDYISFGSNEPSRDPRRNGRSEFKIHGITDRTKSSSERELSEPRRGGRSDKKIHGITDRTRYSIEREENDERRSRRSRDLADDVEMKSGSDQGSANGSVRSRRRSRSPARKVSRASHEREREYRDRRDRDRGDRGDRGAGDYYQGGGRRRSMDRDDDNYRPGRHGDNSSRRHDRRDTNRDRSPRGGDRDRYFSGRERRRSPGPSKKQSPQPTDDERDRRTVFVQQLAARLRTKELRSFFESVGQVVDAQIVKDRVSGRSKGVGYVEFREEESVQKAIGLTGQKLLGIPIIAQLTEAEKNRQSRNTEGAATHSNGVPFHRLYVGNIHFTLGEDELREVFSAFGELEFVQLQKEETGRSKGYGFVQYVDPAAAKIALEQMNGFELLDRPIRVGLGNDKFTPESTKNLLQRFGSQAHQQGSSFSGMGGRGAHAGGSANFDRASGNKEAEKAGGASALDDTDVGGVNMSNFNRHSLMSKLARTDEPEQKIAPKTQQKKPVVEQPAPSRCVLLKHMFNQAEEAAQNPNTWQKDLEEDVRTECENKYGIVVHIGVALDTDDGEIYIKFDRIEGGQNAIRGLNGRYFGGNMISAQYVVDHVYNMMFPAAANR